MRLCRQSVVIKATANWPLNRLNDGLTRAEYGAMISSSKAPGWYLDSTSATRQFRYFDGRQWTAQTAPMPVNGVMPGNPFAGLRSLFSRAGR